MGPNKIQEFEQIEIQIISHQSDSVPNFHDLQCQPTFGRLSCQYQIYDESSSELQESPVLLPQSSTVASKEEKKVVLRLEWTQKQQIGFFNFLAEFMVRYPSEFFTWRKSNKKGIFQEMQSRIKTRDNVQCRLKFFSYKRKHSSRRDRTNFKKNMRILIIQMLEIFSEINEDSKFWLKQIMRRQKNLKTEQKRNKKKMNPLPSKQKYCECSKYNQVLSKINHKNNCHCFMQDYSDKLIQNKDL